MKKTLLLIAALSAFLFCSCGKQKTEEPEVDPTVSVAVSGIGNNVATVSAELLTGKFYSAKIVPAVLVSSLSFDYTKEIALISYVEKNGADVENLPCSIAVEKLRADKDYLSAVIVYDKTGRACASAYATWTAEGNPDGISDENNAGNLGENPIN